MKNFTKKIRTKNELFFLTLFGFSLLALAGFVSGFLGFIIFLLVLIYQNRILKVTFKRYNLVDFPFFSLIILISYYVISLTLLYYISGISRFVLILWNIINFYINYRIGFLNIKFYTFKIISLIENNLYSFFAQNKLNIFLDIFLFISSISLIIYFYLNPENLGRPTPWANIHNLVFILFFFISSILLFNYFSKKENYVSSILYLVLGFCLVAIKYPLSYGYDTLVHQASLSYIAEHGQILPLTPFYIGSYVLELLTYFFTGWKFIFIERFFVPAFFVLFSIVLGQYILHKNNLNKSYNLIGVITLLILPTQFFFSTPYAFSLAWLLISVVNIYYYLRNKSKENLVLAFLSSLVCSVVHPFVGVTIISWLFFLLVYERRKNQWSQRKNILFLILSFLVSSMIVVVAFVAYTILAGHSFSFANPVIYLNNFVNLFSDPYWYNRSLSSVHLWAVYFYEKTHYLLLVSLVAFYFFVKKLNKNANILIVVSIIFWLIYFYNRLPLVFFVLFIILYLLFFSLNKKENFFLILISLSYIISAWLFVSSLEANQLTMSDKVNYSFRLLQAAKISLWVLYFYAFFFLLKYIRKYNQKIILIFVLLLSLVLTSNWYLVYPRQDDISRSNINSIREIDFRAIKKIHDLEYGKEGYVVLSNMLFVGGAMKAYGFGPYYSVSDNLYSYYSMPMSSPLFETYLQIMSVNNFPEEKIDKIMDDFGVNKVYVVTTDYWRMYPNAWREADNISDNYWNYDNKVFVHLFSR